LRNRHTWYWQRQWEELSYQERKDILDEFELNEVYATCGLWKSERQRRAEERQFLFEITRPLEQLAMHKETLVSYNQTSGIGLAWLLETELPAPLAQLVYILDWSKRQHPGGRYRRILKWMKEELDPASLGFE
jgi:hypothetical protein